MQILAGHLILSASDLVGHLACGHLTVLEREAAEVRRTRPIRLDPALAVIAKRGFEREEKFLAEARDAGRRIVEFPGEPLRGIEALREADRLTLEAMRSGADVTAQAVFFDARWQGWADFLLRVDRPSGLGGWSYEPADAKLSRIVKGAAILQLCLYADQLRRFQGTAPERIAVVTGDGRLHHYRLDDYDVSLGPAPLTDRCGESAASVAEVSGERLRTPPTLPPAMRECRHDLGRAIWPPSTHRTSLPALDGDTTPLPA